MSAVRGRRIAALVVALLGLSALPATAAGPTVFVRDNEFVRAGTGRPTVRVRAGSIVAWRWASRQSHNVTVRSGPQRFRSPTQSAGTFRRRLVRRGTYRLGCSLHAPGMRMTLVVR
jgi:plastocyanin